MATKAIHVSLRDDGTFYAVFNDYAISEKDSFVNRPDSKAIPMDFLYTRGTETVERTQLLITKVPLDGDNKIVCFMFSIMKFILHSQYAKPLWMQSFSHLKRIAHTASIQLSHI